MLADLVLPGIGHQAFTDLAIVALLLGLVNAFVRPVLLLLTLPFVLFTVGIGFLIINALLLWMVGSIVPGFRIEGFWSAFFGGMIISVTSSLVGSLLGGGARVRVHRAGRRPAGGDRRDPPGGTGPVIDV
jgi:putative membrane protein